MQKGELILGSTLLTIVKDLALVEAFLSKPLVCLMENRSSIYTSKTKILGLRDDCTVLNWLLNKLIFYDTNSHFSKRPPLLLDCETAVISVKKSIEDQRAANTRQMIKDYQVITKCSEMKEKITRPTRCKLCEELVTLDQLADHSFKCFDKKTLYLELDKINKMVLKLRTTCGKTRTLLCSLC